VAGKRVCVAAIAGAHGVRGLVRLKAFTEDPDTVGDLGPLSDEAGERSFQVTVVGHAKGVVLAQLTGVEDRDRAQALKGVRLYAERAALPALEDEETFYHADLIGLAVEDRAGRPLGRVRALHDFGAGDLIEIEGGDGTTTLLPFTRAAVPVVDLEAGRVVVEPPAEDTAATPSEGRENVPEDGGGAGHGAAERS
jgi:16S rRNA processing protein RimM